MTALWYSGSLRKNRCSPCIAFVLISALAWGCASTVVPPKPLRSPETPAGPHFSLLTYNVNWGRQSQDTVDAIGKRDADIVCLQETNVMWESKLRNTLGKTYPHMIFRETPGRAGGGLAFLCKHPFKELKYIPSTSAFFDGWLIQCETPIGPVQVLNVHLQPPVNKNGEFGVSGYLYSPASRKAEIERFYRHVRPGIPAIVAGDFNEIDKGVAVVWLKKRGYTNALPEFDRKSNTWRWRTSVGMLRRRLDHILYPTSLHCYSASVEKEGGSDHFPVRAIFGKSVAPVDQ